ncbi:MAG: RNA-binding S4 domain-containing protein [Pseudomonadota bacterium]
MGEPPEASSELAGERLRLDRWLFFSRLVKSRSLAAKHIEAGRVRVNSTKTHQPKRLVGAGDVLTITLPAGIKIVKVLACGARRGPASEAQMLYEDLTPPPPPREPADGPSLTAPSPGRRPTKHERELLQRLKGRR